MNLESRIPYLGGQFCAGRRPLQSKWAKDATRFKMKKKLNRVNRKKKDIIKPLLPFYALVPKKRSPQTPRFMVAFKEPHKKKHLKESNDVKLRQFAANIPTFIDKESCRNTQRTL